MTGITSAGVGSGLDLEAIIEVTVNAENQPKVEALDKKESSLDIKLTALGQMKSDISALEDAIEALSDIENFNKRSATVSQPANGDVISVSAESTATAGNFEIEVKQLAQGSRAVQDDANSYSSTTDVVTASGGTLTLTAGANTFDVTLAAGATLEDLRTAINEHADNFGLSANIINTGGATPLSKLVITSSETGTGNDLVITNNTAELDKVSTVANGGGNGGLVIAATDQAQDAIILIDGITTNSSTNTFTNTIQDITITALKVDTEKASLTVDTDKEAVKETIESFVDGFNTAMNTLDQVVTSRVTDGTARGLRTALINQVSSIVSGAGSLTSVYDLGLSLNKNNELEINNTGVNTLEDSLNENYDDIGNLFAGAGGIAQILNDTVELYTKSGGIIAQQEDSVNQQLKDVENDRERHEYRMEQFEKRLREQYASLDVLIASMRAQGTAVTSALSNLPGFSSGKS
ncbi:flagellar filament capping protein FliD [Thalassotalea sp. SU-HH00458]|uniref:flagellar filament capping protein FliD n=1 Tax=Thalassotalea sp. SU-HH00458 TaxID=3127657 RepID=UPI0031060E98